MSKYVTYMEVSLYSEGVTPGELTETLRDLGWKPIFGRYDYVFDWGSQWGGKETNIQEYFEHIRTTHEILRNHKIYYSLRTFEKGTETFPPWD